MLENYFAENLKKLRKFHNIKQIELAQAIGSTRSAISYYESGKSEPTLKVIVSIAKFFNISVDELLKNHNFNGEYSELQNTLFQVEIMLQENYIDKLYDLKNTYTKKLEELQHIVDVDLPNKIDEIDKFIKYIEKDSR